MELETNKIIQTVKYRYLEYLHSQKLSDDFITELPWNEDKHITVYAIKYKRNNNYNEIWESLIFCMPSKEDTFKIIQIPDTGEIPFVDRKHDEELLQTFIDNDLILSIDSSQVIESLVSTWTYDYNDPQDVLEGLIEWSYKFLDITKAYAEINQKYKSLNNSTASYVEIDQKYKSLNNSTVELIDGVNDRIFSYQYKEASELFYMGYYLGAGCVFGVALERICMLIAKKNELKLQDDKTEIGYFAYELYKNKVISNSYKKRLLGSAKFRNISAHTNAKATKSDSIVLDTIIQDLINEYL